MQMFDLSSLQLPDGLLPGGYGRKVRSALAGVHGLSMDSAHAGRFSVGDACGRVTSQRGDSLRVSFELENPHSPGELLETTCRLPGNLRWAVVSSKPTLLSDMQLNGESHLHETLSRIGRAVADESIRVKEERRTERPDKEHKEALDPKRVDQALVSASHDAESLVRLDRGWELRPKLHGEPTPVQALIDGDELRLHQELVSLDANGSGFRAAAHQALRFNGRLRHCRLAADGRRIVAETRLHAGQVQSVWLLSAARAVAVAVRHCQTTLMILAQQEQVAQRYEEMFLK